LRAAHFCVLCKGGSPIRLHRGIWRTIATLQTTFPKQKQNCPPCQPRNWTPPLQVMLSRQNNPLVLSQTMNAMSPAKRALAILSIFGCLCELLMLAALIGGRMADILTLVSDFMLLATGAYFLWIGIRALRSAEVLQGECGGFGWGRILIGCWIVFSNLNNRYHPAPNLLHSSNETQAVAMKATEMAILCGTVGLIVWGIAIGFRRRVPR
jgi:hypothetical protein